MERRGAGRTIQHRRASYHLSKIGEVSHPRFDGGINPCWPIAVRKAISASAMLGASVGRKVGDIGSNVKSKSAIVASV